MAEYLVTGGTSFIASHVINAPLETQPIYRSREALTRQSRCRWSLPHRLAVFCYSGWQQSDDFLPQDKMIDPDISGTRNLMNSCEKSRNTVKRIVLTSSSTSIWYRFNATQVSPLNESDWSDLEYCKRFKIWYGYAKTLVEKEAWMIAAEKKLNLVVVIPSFTIGQILRG
ncbi:unnamed protein product [Arabis nemorensis]|uniref:NAD-dependent epimerase/dehydratase domain-containing protein n=1 Tax=Arabis nemorensis TaxID=586526 RepID=A0A565BAT1_9BRAS|nr:unnamed protein product [Arabis nemorensis]